MQEHGGLHYKFGSAGVAGAINCAQRHGWLCCTLCCTLAMLYTVLHRRAPTWVAVMDFAPPPFPTSKKKKKKQQQSHIKMVVLTAPQLLKLHRDAARKGCGALQVHNTKNVRRLRVADKPYPQMVNALELAASCKRSAFDPIDCKFLAKPHSWGASP
eukprot:scaffold291782_cov22-Tisochrysis_lutea.AAC.1